MYGNGRSLLWGRRRQKGPLFQPESQNPFPRPIPTPPGGPIAHLLSVLALELEQIQTQMTQKPMLRAEVYARALRASQTRKEDSV